MSKSFKTIKRILNVHAAVRSFIFLTLDFNKISKMYVHDLTVAQ